MPHDKTGSQSSPGCWWRGLRASGFGLRAQGSGGSSSSSFKILFRPYGQPFPPLFTYSLFFAVRIYPEARITDRLHELRLYLSELLFSQTHSKSFFEPLSDAEEIVNGLCRLKIGRLPPTQMEREIVSKIKTRFDATKSENFKNRAILALALFL